MHAVTFRKTRLPVILWVVCKRKPLLFEKNIKVRLKFTREDTDKDQDFVNVFQTD